MHNLASLVLELALQLSPAGHQDGTVEPCFLLHVPAGVLDCALRTLRHGLGVQVLEYDGVGRVRHLATDVVSGVVPAPGLLALQFAQFPTGPAAALGALLLPGHPVLVPLDLRVLNGRVGDSVYDSGAVRGLFHIAVNAHGSFLCGPAHIGVVDGHLEHDGGVPLRLLAFGLLPYANGQTQQHQPKHQRPDREPGQSNLAGGTEHGKKRGQTARDA